MPAPDSSPLPLPSPTTLPDPSSNPLQMTVNLPTGANWQFDIGGVVHTIGAVVAILVVAFVFMRLARLFIAGMAETLLKREHVEGSAKELTADELRKRQDTISVLGVNVIRSFVIVIAGLMILEAAFKVDIGPAVAGLGIVGIAIGLGTQHLVRDYLNGVLILIENQYDKGDVVCIAGLSGKVEDFTLRRTTLRDDDGSLHTVPNGQINVASNLTRVFAHVNQDVQVSYRTDIDKAEAVVEEMGRAMAEDARWSHCILQAPHVDQVLALGAYGVTLRITTKVKASEQWAVGGELRKRLLRAFRDNGIEIPQPMLMPQTASGAAPSSDGASELGAGREEAPVRELIERSSGA